MLGAFANAGITYVNGGNFRQVLVSFAAGGVGGAVAGLTFRSDLGLIVGGGVAGLLGGLAQGLVQETGDALVCGGSFEAGDLLLSPLLGAATGPLGAGVAARPGLSGGTSLLAEALFAADVTILAGIGNQSP